MQNKKGFTLLELIIVIIVIGILVAMALPQFTKVAERGRIAKAKGYLDMFRKAEGVYHAINSTYADDISLLTTDIPELAEIDNDLEWDYTITADDSMFEVVLTRIGGEYDGETITINQLGQVSGTHELR
jgi:prepilin-type N-terminal cleavage/methylation domain-containing protein